MSKSADSERRWIVQNRRARHEYELLEQLECGMVLRGTEIKSLRSKGAALEGAFAHFRGSELFLIGATIAEYGFGNVHNHDPQRDRKLLAHRRELERWRSRVKEKGLTMVPLGLYLQGSRAKALLALARGKRQVDKRHAVREREDRRDVERALSRARKRAD
jgi:SsrA-binding protein